MREALGLAQGIFQDRKTTFGEGFRDYSGDEPAPTIVNGNTLSLTNYKVYSLKYLKEKKSCNICKTSTKSFG